jgi:probable F420-dependent oxidoreductase
MKVYAAFDDPRMPLGLVPAYAERAERLGFAGLLVPEAVHDAFLTALLALEHTRRMRIITSVVVAFARSPMTVAYAAWDLQAFSGGRFALGLGSQVKANIVGRFGVEWRPPVARMRDYVRALRTIWQSWQTGSKLAFTSENYRFDRMQPFFNPGPIEHPDIPILLGGVNPRMTRLAGEVADGFMSHPTNTSPRYLREVTVAELAAGAEIARGKTTPLELIASTFVATGPTPADVARERERLREYLGFLYSTPQYWRTLELHGWSETGERLHALGREGRWDEMKRAVSDEILDALVPTGTYDRIVPVLLDRYGGLATGITLRMPDNPGADGAFAAMIERLAEHGAT